MNLANYWMRPTTRTWPRPENRIGTLFNVKYGWRRLMVEAADHTTGNGRSAGSGESSPAPACGTGEGTV